jgi:hypothetical protein
MLYRLMCEEMMPRIRGKGWRRLPMSTAIVARSRSIRPGGTSNARNNLALSSRFTPNSSPIRARSGSPPN